MQRRKPKPAGAPGITEGRNPAAVSLDTKPIAAILRAINREDQKVARAVERVIPEIAEAVEIIVPALAEGGRLVYIGAGTSGRLGALDAAECGPTFGTNQVIAVLSGGPGAMLKAVEGAEDDVRLAVRDLRRIKLTRRDVLLGITASGRTPYTCAALRYASKNGAKTIALTSNPGSLAATLATVAIVPVTGPEVVAGSTRMKAGTAQKLALNMLSTTSMIRLGKVYSGMMTGMQAANSKLTGRAVGILAKATGSNAAKSRRVLKASGGNLQVALLMLAKRLSKEQAKGLLRDGANIAQLLREATEAKEPETRL